MFELILIKIGKYFAEKLLDYLTGEIYSALKNKLKEGLSNSEFAIKIKDKINNRSEEVSNAELRKWIKTVLARSFNKLSLTKEQKKNISSCQQFKDIVVEWIINSDQNIVQYAHEVNFVRWEFRIDGNVVKDLLITIAEEIKKSFQEFLTPGEQIIVNQNKNLPEQIANKLASQMRPDEQILEEIKSLTKIGKVWTALVKAKDLNRNYLSNTIPDSFRLSILEQISICQGRLHFSVSPEEHSETLNDMLKHTIDQAKKERIRATIAYLNENNKKALEHCKRAVALDQNPRGYVAKIIMEFIFNGIETAQRDLESIPKAIIEKEASQFAECYYLVKDYSNAEFYATLYLENQLQDIHCLVLLAEVQMMKIQDELYSVNSYKGLDDIQLSEFEQRLYSIKENLNDEDEYHAFLYYEMNGILWVWRRNYHFAEISFRKAYELNQSNQRTLLYLIKCLYIRNEKIEVLELVDKLDNSDFSSITLRSQVLLECGNVDRVLNDIRGAMSTLNLKREEILRLKEIEILTLRKFGNPKLDEAADQIEINIRDEFSDIPYVYKIKAESLLEMEQVDEAIECLRAALPEEIADSDYSHIGRILLRLLSASSKQTDINQAIHIAETLFTPIHIDELAITYLKLLCNQADFSKCIKMCNDIENIHGFNEDVKDVEATALFQLKEYSLSLSICTELFKKNNNVRTVNLLCWNLLRLGRFQEIENIIKRSEVKFSKNILFLVLCREVFKQIHYLQESESSINLYLKYARLAIEVSDYSKEHIDEYITFYISLPEQSQIKITEEHRIFYKKLFESYFEKYPESEVIERLIVPEDPNDFLIFMIEILSKNNNQYNEIKENFKGNKLPISYLATMLKKDVLQTWQYVTLVPDIRVYMCDGFIEETLADDQAIIGNVDILISSHSLLLLHNLGLLDSLASAFQSISVTQSNYEQLLILRNSLVKSSQEGSTSIALYNGLPRITEINSTIHQKQLQDINDIITFLTNSCQKIGHIKLEYDHNKNSKIEKVLGSESTELMMSLNQQYIVFSDDLFVRRASKSLTNKESTYILPYIRKLRKTLIIDLSKYSNIIVELIRLNYYCIPIEQEVLRQVIIDANYSISDKVQVCFKAMYDDSIEIDSLVGVLLSLLNWLWIEPCPKYSRELLTQYIIDIVSKRTTLKYALNLLKNNITNIISPQNHYVMDDFLSLLTHLERIVI